MSEFKRKCKQFIKKNILPFSPVEINLPQHGVTSKLVRPGVRTIKYDFKGPLLELDPECSSREYYFMWKELISRSDSLDSNGVFLQEWNQQKTYHPVAIAQYGLNMYSNYVETKEKIYLEEAKNQANYFVQNIDINTGMFFYDFDFQVGGTNQTLCAPWGSAMAQGQVLSLLARIYYLTKEEEYLHTIMHSMKSLQIDIKDGGLRERFFGYPVYEEYPTEIPNYTLNGFMFTLIGLYEAWETTGNEMAYQLYREGFVTLRFMLPFYDTRGVSLYHLGHLFERDLQPHISTSYHKLHVQELRVINKWENDEILDFYINRWTSYVNG